MKFLSLSLGLCLLAGFSVFSKAHDSTTSLTHSHLDPLPNHNEGLLRPEWFLAQSGQNGTVRPTFPPGQTVQSPSTTMQKPRTAYVFDRFAPRVVTRWDNQFLYVENNGMPAHSMMVGITNWQQQVPLPQRYTGLNAWRIPLQPVAAAEPVTIKGRFLRGAIALAANGIPIFNPQNNRGEISAEIGELDQWGGHCGRADDYHYHAAPLHLQQAVGPGEPIAYALDGYPILGLTEANGSQPVGLDNLNGHANAATGYHYHASSKYPYINGGFHGVVSEIEGQVDPQPRATPVREALPPLRGAKITGFETNGKNLYKLTYELNSEKRAVLYATGDDGSVTFEFQNGREGTTRQNYAPKQGGGGPPQNRPGNDRPPGQATDQGQPKKPNRPDNQGRQPEPVQPPKRNGETAPTANSVTITAPAVPGFVLRSTEVQDGGTLPIEYTGDGAGSTLPLQWAGAPASTKSYTLVMHHLDPEGKTKWYWILYNIPPTIQSLPKNTKDIGALGSNFKGQPGYEAPHSKGPGAKTYVLSLFALSSPLEFAVPAARIDYNTIMTAIQGKVLGRTDLSVVYTRTGTGEDAPQRPGPRPPEGSKPGRTLPPPQSGAPPPANGSR